MEQKEGEAMSDAEFALLFRLLVEYSPPEPELIRLIWLRINAIWNAHGAERKEETS